METGKESYHLPPLIMVASPRLGPDTRDLRPPGGRLPTRNNPLIVRAFTHRRNETQKHIFVYIATPP